MYPTLSTYNTEFVALAVGMMNLFVVWALSIVVSIETTLFYGKTFDVSHSVFLINLKTRHRFTIWVRVIGYMAKTSRESKGIVFVIYDQFNQSGSGNGNRAPAFNLLVTENKFCNTESKSQ